MHTEGQALCFFDPVDPAVNLICEHSGSASQKTHFLCITKNKPAKAVVEMNTVDSANSTEHANTPSLQNVDF
jgi:hypothetical protein